MIAATTSQVLECLQEPKTTQQVVSELCGELMHRLAETEDMDTYTELMRRIRDVRMAFNALVAEAAIEVRDGKWTLSS